MSQEIEKYEFVRIRDKRNGEVMKSWYFRARSYHDIRVHTEKVFAPLMQVGYNDVAGKAVEAIFGKGKLCCVEHPDTDAGNAIDEGARLVDTSGTTVLREPSGKRHIEGEVKFKWIFYAEVTESDATISRVSKPDNSIINSGDDSDGGSKIDVDIPDEPRRPSDPGIPDVIQTGETIAFVAIGAVMFATLLLIVLVLKKKKKKKKKADS